MSDDTKKRTAKATAAKKTTVKKATTKEATAKKATAEEATAKKATAETKASKKREPKKVDTVEIETKTKKKTTRKRTSTPKIEIVDTTDSAVSNVSEPIVEETIVDEPIVIDEPVTAIQIDNRSSESGERHGGFLNMLYRHPRNRMLSGVCGGIADYLGWDAMIVRVLWAALTVMTGGIAGMIAYGALSLVLPVGSKSEGFVRPGKIEMSEQNLARASYGLIGVGVLMLLSNIGLLSWLFVGARAVIGVIFWPAVLVTIGLLLLNRNGDQNYRATLANGLNSMREQAESMRSNSDFNIPEAGTIRESFTRFRNQMPVKRSRRDRVIAGVCGGIGRTVGIDANLVRVGFAIMTVATGGFPLLVMYFLLGVVLPSDGSAQGGDKIKDEITIIEHM